MCCQESDRLALFMRRRVIYNRDPAVARTAVSGAA